MKEATLGEAIVSWRTAPHFSPSARVVNFGTSIAPVCPLIGAQLWRPSCRRLQLTIAMAIIPVPKYPWRVTCDVWRVTCGVWRVACGVWRVACGVWRVMCEVWRVVCGV